MTTRRHILLSGAALLAAPALARAQAAPSELIFVGGAAENASGITERFTPFAEYLGRRVGTRVTLRLVNDYAAIIEGHRSGHVHIAFHGPSSYVRALTVTNGGVEPFVTNINPDGSTGYYAVAYVRAGDAAQSLQDLRGRNLGLVDPNSTSGNNVPRFAMDKLGIDPERFFGRVVYAGSHENAIIALQQGTVDVAFNWWNSETDSNLTRMAQKNMARVEAFRVVFRSDKIAGGPVVMNSNLPAPLKAAITQAFLDAPTADKAAFDRLSDGQWRGFARVTHDDYRSAVELQTFVDALRRRRGT